MFAAATMTDPTRPLPLLTSNESSVRAEPIGDDRLNLFMKGSKPPIKTVEQDN
jgi:hypothetical protein